MTWLENPVAHLARNVLVDSDRGVDAPALLEQGADSSSRALGGNEDDINVRRGHDTGVLLVDDREAVSKVESLALGL